MADSPLFNKSILCTGASGTFGNAFVRRALADGASRVVCYSRGEARQAEMKAAIRDDRMRYYIGDVRDVDRITDACRGVDIVVHAAALKRIDTCEEDPYEAIATNILGTQAVQRACIAQGVRKAVNLSTDKAAAPCTLYGMTKATAERTWAAGNVYSAGRSTRFSSTRYGNVISSTGSVIPIWKRQIQEQGGITITDPNATRFWMRIEDAVNLVILALEKMRGGETFVPVIPSSTIDTLRLAVAPEASAVITGLRPGEKKHELLISADESRHTYKGDGYYLIEPETRTWENLSPIALPKVPFGFEYGSNTNPNLSVERLREMIA
jgi:UDP-N-acetylglucosamine 4,6-dehydratase